MKKYAALVLEDGRIAWPEGRPGKHAVRTLALEVECRPSLRERTPFRGAKGDTQ